MQNDELADDDLSNLICTQNYYSFVRNFEKLTSYAK